jgi:hypothetical protein
VEATLTSATIAAKTVPVVDSIVNSDGCLSTGMTARNCLVIAQDNRVSNYGKVCWKDSVV